MQHLILVVPMRLQYASVPLVTNEKCSEFYTLTENMVCAGTSEKSSCSGDSGKATIEPCK